MTAEFLRNDNLDENIESFLLFQSNNNIFQSLAIYKTFQNVKNWEPVFILAQDRKKTILGTLLAIIQKENSGIYGIFSSRSIIIGGPIIFNNKIEVLDFLLRTYNEKIGNKVIYSQFRNLRQFSSDEKKIFKNHGYNYEAHLDIIHSLNTPIEEQIKRIHKGRRKNIRRSERMGLSFREIEDSAEFEKSVELVKETYERVKLPMPDKSLFWECWKNLKGNGIFKVFVAIFDNEIIATRMVMCYNALIYDWYAGACNRHMDKYPNDFLPWKIIEWGSNQGYKYFDFGGAGKPNIPYGVRDHKLKFGGKLVEYGRFQKIHNPVLYKAISFLFKIYRKIAK